MFMFILAASLFALSGIAMMLPAVYYRKKYAVLTYGFAMRTITIPLFSIANLFTGLSAFSYLVSDWVIYIDGRCSISMYHMGYLRLAYYITVSIQVILLLFLIERWIVSEIIQVAWNISYRKDIVKSISLLEQKKNEYTTDSEWYMEIVCKLSSLYYSLIRRARRKGRTDLVSEYKLRLNELKNVNQTLVIR